MFCLFQSRVTELSRIQNIEDLKICVILDLQLYCCDMYESTALRVIKQHRRYTLIYTMAILDVYYFHYIPSLSLHFFLVFIYCLLFVSITVSLLSTPSDLHLHNNLKILIHTLSTVRCYDLTLDHLNILISHYLHCSYLPLLSHPLIPFSLSALRG